MAGSEKDSVSSQRWSGSVSFPFNDIRIQRQSRRAADSKVSVTVNDNMSTCRVGHLFSSDVILQSHRVKENSGKFDDNALELRVLTEDVVINNTLIIDDFNLR